MCDLLWSDPQPQVSLNPGGVSPKASPIPPRRRLGDSHRRVSPVPGVTVAFPQNGRSVSKRGVSCQFGPDVTKSFLERNRLDYIIRSHEVKPEGYEVAHDGKCVTVFSAPNYW